MGGVVAACGAVEDSGGCYGELHAWDRTVSGLANYLRSGQWKQEGDEISDEAEDGEWFQDELLQLRLAAILYPVTGVRSQE